MLNSLGRRTKRESMKFTNEVAVIVSQIAYRDGDDHLVQISASYSLKMIFSFQYQTVQL